MTHSFSTEGITFTVYGDEEAEERIIPVDCIPRIITAAEWDFLERGLIQRVTTLNRFLSDVYSEGPNRLGWRHSRSTWCAGARSTASRCSGMEPPLGVWVAICGTDIVRTNDGFFVLEDNLRVPSGVSYMIANRKAVKAGLRRVYRGYARPRRRELRPPAARDTAGAGAARAVGPVRGAADAWHLQLGVLRAHVLGGRARRAAGRGARPAGERRFRLHAPPPPDCTAST